MGRSSDAKTQPKPGLLTRSFAARASLLVVALALISGLTFDAKLYVSGDNVDYMLLTRGILEGEDLWASRKFPPLFPLLLAPVQAIFGNAVLAQKLFVFFLYLLCGPLLLRLAERLLPRRWAFGAALLPLIGVPMLEFSHYVMSEIPFLFLSLAALVVGETVARRALSEEEPARTQTARRPGLWRHLVLYFVLAGCAFYTRSIGIVLLAALPFVLLSARRGIAFMWSVALALVVLLPWVLHTWFAGAQGESYLNQALYVNPYFPEAGRLTLGSFVERVLGNGREYFAGGIPRGLVPFAYASTYSATSNPPPTLPWPMGLLVALLLLASLFVLRRRAPVTVVYSIAFLIVCIVWPPVWASVRFILPVLPLLFLMLAVALWRGLTRIFRREEAASVGLGSVLTVVLMLSLYGALRYGEEVGRYPPRWEMYFRAAEWAEANLPPGSRVVDRKPNMFTLVTDLPAIGFPREPDDERMLAYMRRESVAFVHASTIPYDDLTRFLHPFLTRQVGHFEGVWFEQGREGAWSMIVAFHPHGRPRSDKGEP